MDRIRIALIEKRVMLGDIFARFRNEGWKIWEVVDEGNGSEPGEPGTRVPGARFEALF